MKVSEREISRQMKVAKLLYLTPSKISKKKNFQGQQKIGCPSIFSSGNKRFIRKRVSQSPKSSAEKKLKIGVTKIKVAKKKLKISMTKIKFTKKKIKQRYNKSKAVKKKKIEDKYLKMKLA